MMADDAALITLLHPGTSDDDGRHSDEHGQTGVTA